MEKSIQELGLMKPPRQYMRGARISLKNPRNKHAWPEKVTFLQWVRAPGLVCDEDPWWAKIINTNGRVEVVHSRVVP